MDNAAKRTIKIAAVGDLHVGETGGNRSSAEMFKEISSVADVLVLCGDLTNVGSLQEAHRLAECLKIIDIPIVGVLGNHDHESNLKTEVEDILINAGMRPLEDHIQEIAGVGFAGVKGFGSGFGKSMLGSFGESAIKAFVEESVRECTLLEHALHQLARLDRVVVVLHYAPVVGTLTGEPLEIYPFLGSSRLEETIDRFENIKAVFHGHAHRGVYKSTTKKGIPVYNCVIHIEKENGHPYALIEV